MLRCAAAGGDGGAGDSVTWNHCRCDSHACEVRAEHPEDQAISLCSGCKCQGNFGKETAHCPQSLSLTEHAVCVDSQILLGKHLLSCLSSAGPSGFIGDSQCFSVTNCLVFLGFVYAKGYLVSFILSGQDEWPQNARSFLSEIKAMCILFFFLNFFCVY